MKGYIPNRRGKYSLVEAMKRSNDGKFKILDFECHSNNFFSNNIILSAYLRAAIDFSMRAAMRRAEILERHSVHK